MGADYYETTNLIYITNDNVRHTINIEYQRGYYYFSYNSDSENDYELQKKKFLDHIEEKVLYENNKWNITSKFQIEKYIRFLEHDIENIRTITKQKSRIKR